MKITGIGWNLINALTRQVGSAARFFIVAAAIGPGGMGQFAIAVSLFAGANVFAELGFKQLYISRQADRTFVNESEALIGSWLAYLGLRIAVCVLLVPLALITDVWLEVECAALAISLAAVSLFNAFTNPGMLLEERNGHFRSPAIAETVAQIIGVIVSITVVLLIPTPWALVAGQGGAGITLSALSYAISPVPKWQWPNLYSIIRLIKRGAPFLVIGIATFITSSLDKLLIAAMAGTVVTGTYFVAQRLMEVPASIFSIAFSRTLYPRYGRVWEESKGPAELKRLVSKASLICLAFFGGLLGVLVGLQSNLLLEWVSLNWHPSIALAPILLVGVGFRASCHVIAPALVVTDNASFAARLRVQESVMHLVTLPTLAYMNGAKGAAEAFAIVYGIAYFRRLYFIRKL